MTVRFVECLVTEVNILDVCNGGFRAVFILKASLVVRILDQAVPGPIIGSRN